MTADLLLALAMLAAPLGAESFPAREAAQARLEAALLGPGGHLLVPWLESLAAQDLEVRRRVERALAEFALVRPTASPRLPWLDTLPPATPGREQTVQDYRKRAHAAGAGPHGPQWHDYRLATALWAADQLRAGVPRAELARLLDEMAAGERRYKASRGLPEDY